MYILLELAYVCYNAPVIQLCTHVRGWPHYGDGVSVCSHYFTLSYHTYLVHLRPSCKLRISVRHSLTLLWHKMNATH